MVSRPLTVGEHNLIANALFLRQEDLRKRAWQTEQSALMLEAKHGEENSGVQHSKELARRLYAEAEQVFNLELLVRRESFTLNLEGPIHIQELA